MSNDLAGRPWMIDQEDDVPVVSSWVKINTLQWMGYTDPTHTVEVYDSDDRLLFIGDGHDDLSPVVCEAILGWVKGIKVPKIDSGKLIIYIE